jgi:hypothetical protein
MQVLGFILGHLVGDYLFQNEFMAVNKVKKDMLGWFACLSHSIVYTIWLVLFLYLFNRHDVVNWSLLFVLIFLTHFPIDKWSLGKYWLKFIKGNKTIPTEGPAYPIYWFVYIVADNTLHFLLMTLVLMQWFPSLLK